MPISFDGFHTLLQPFGMTRPSHDDVNRLDLLRQFLVCYQTINDAINYGELRITDTFFSKG